MKCFINFIVLNIVISEGRHSSQNKKLYSQSLYYDLLNLRPSFNPVVGSGRPKRGSLVNHQKLMIKNGIHPNAQKIMPLAVGLY